MRKLAQTRLYRNESNFGFFDPNIRCQAQARINPEHTLILMPTRLCSASIVSLFMKLVALLMSHLFLPELGTAEKVQIITRRILSQPKKTLYAYVYDTRRGYIMLTVTIFMKGTKRTCMSSSGIFPCYQRFAFSSTHIACSVCSVQKTCTSPSLFLSQFNFLAH
jgi:hypothetical protein